MRGFLQKMAADVPASGCTHDDPVQYSLRLDDETMPLNPHIGSAIKLAYTGRIACLECGRATKKSFSQGYCYPCFKRLAQCDMCIVSPERCHFDQGTCRDESFAEDFCMQPHIVYLANSSGLKVGITRPANLPTRWIDQGAVQALPILSVMTRQQSGLVEVAFKQHISDKTNWQQMLKSDGEVIDLVEARDTLLPQVEKELGDLTERFGIQAVQPIIDAEVQRFVYPIDKYPTKVKSHNLDKNPEIEGVLEGIKGQYLILDTGVINLRKFTSYEIEFSATGADADPQSQLSLL